MNFLGVKFILIFTAPLVLGSSLKGSKGISHGVESGLKCHSEYDDVWEEKCSTIYEDKCTTITNKECHPSVDRQCSVKEEESCAFTTTQKCSSIPIPKCRIVWEKSCSQHPVCKTHYEKQCSTVHRPKCHFQHEKQCHQLVETVCKDNGKGHVKAKGSKGVHGEQVELHKRSADEKAVNGTADSGAKLPAKEAYAIHKQTLLDLKAKVEAELAALKLEDSNDTAKDGHALSKRSRSAIVDYNPKRKQQKRSLETLSRQLSTEIQILEEGDFTGDIEQINEKRRKRSPRPEAEDFLDGLLPKDPRGLLSKRSLKEEKGKGASSGSCWDEPREKCTSIPKEVCETVAEEICTDVPREVCEEVESCKDLPKKDCEIIYKEICATLPTRECHSVPKEFCIDVPKEICEDVPKEVCVPVPGKHCEKVVVKRPREVCLPPQKVRVLEQSLPSEPSY